MWSAAARGRAINAFQRKEILALAAADLDTAKKEAARPHYTHIGDWLPAGEGGRVLEIGCGPGRYVALLAALGYDVVGADPVPFPLWDDIKALRKAEFISGIHVEALPFEDNSFDHVACLGALLYFDNPGKALTEIKRVLKPGGKLFMRTVNRENLVRHKTGKNIDPASKNFYTEQELAATLTKAGFTVDGTFAYGFYPPIFPATWWYLANGKIPIFVQEWISKITPRRHRVNVVARAQLKDV